jgi:hypothetical protein
MPEMAISEPPANSPFFDDEWELWDYLTKSTHESWVVGRAEVNKWLGVWDFSNSEELLGRLVNKKDQNVQAALFELYLNWFLRDQGLSVERGTDAISEVKPDFLVQSESSKFYVEATIRYIPSDTNFKKVLAHLNSLPRNDYFVGISVEQRGTSTPSIKKLIAEVNNFLDTIDDSRTARNPFSDIPYLIVENNDWVFEISAFKNNSGGNIRNVGLSSPNRVVEVRDKENLLTKIEKKRSKYKGLEFPLVLAVLENCSPFGNPNLHRFDALMGDLQVQYSVNDSKLSRAFNGLWNSSNPDRNLWALLLFSKLDCTEIASSIPQLWLNPNLSSEFLESEFRLKTFKVHDHLYGHGDGTGLTKY